MLHRMAAPDSAPPVVVAEQKAERLSASDLVLDEPHAEDTETPLRADATEEISADAILEVASAVGDGAVTRSLPPPAPNAKATPAAARGKRPVPVGLMVRLGAVFAAAALLGLVSFGPLTLRMQARPTLDASTRADVAAPRSLREAPPESAAAPAPQPVATVASNVQVVPPRAPKAAAKVASRAHLAVAPRAPKPAPKAAPPKVVVSTQVAVAAPRAPRSNAPSALLRSTRDRHVYF